MKMMIWLYVIGFLVAVVLLIYTGMALYPIIMMIITAAGGVLNVGKGAINDTIDDPVAYGVKTTGKGGNALWNTGKTIGNKTKPGYLGKNWR